MSESITLTFLGIREMTHMEKIAMVAQMAENLPAMQEIQVPFLGWEDPLEEGMATQSSTLVWKIP